MSAEPILAAKKAAPLDQKLVRRLAHAAWAADLQENDEALTAEARKKSWDLTSKQYTTKARRMLRQLERRGVTFAITGAE